jgi:hypothetical protein
MRNNRKTKILIGAAALLIFSSIFLVVNKRYPAVKELLPDSATRVSPIDEFVSENTESVEIPPDLRTNETIHDVQDVVEVSPTARADLESTNPETVKLASGEIQLVELFAFW